MLTIDVEEEVKVRVAYFFHFRMEVLNEGFKYLGFRLKSHYYKSQDWCYIRRMVEFEIDVIGRCLWKVGWY